MGGTLVLPQPDQEQEGKLVLPGSNEHSGASPKGRTPTIGPAPSYAKGILDAGVNSSFPYIHPINALEKTTEPLENYTPTARAQHPVLSRIGDVTSGMKELGGIVGPEIATLGMPETPISKAIPGLAQIGPELGEGIGNLAREGIGNVASKLRNPATEAQSLAGKAGTIKPILPPAMQRWAIPDWAIPKGEPGSITNPGPFKDILRHAPPKGWADAPEIVRGREYEQRAQDLMRRGKEEELLGRKQVLALKGNPTPFGQGMTATGVPSSPPSPGGISPIPRVQYVEKFEKPSALTGSATKPFEPLIWESPEEAAAHDLRMKNIERQASSAGKYHAAQGATGKRGNLQLRIGRKEGS